MSLAELRRRKQTTVRGCWQRALFEIRKGKVYRTPLADTVLKEYLEHPGLMRAESMQHADFCQVLRQLTDVARFERQGLAVVTSKKPAMMATRTPHIRGVA
jgi:hypothetical protein